MLLKRITGRRLTTIWLCSLSQRIVAVPPFRLSSPIDSGEMAVFAIQKFPLRVSGAATMMKRVVNVKGEAAPEKRYRVSLIFCRLLIFEFEFVSGQGHWQQGRAVAQGQAADRAPVPAGPPGAGARQEDPGGRRGGPALAQRGAQGS